MNIGGVVLPFIAFLIAIPTLWNSLVGWTDLAIFIALYLLTGLGITVGFHRLFTHRAFETYRPVKYAIAVLGSMAVQGPVIGWVADHRKHHAHTDEEGDPHSPHVGHGGGSGWRGTLRGLWYAHVGWLFDYASGTDAKRYAPDLLEDRGMVLISRAFPFIVTLGLVIPFAAGWALTGELAGALTALLWGGFVRIFLLHHVTWSINSICHFFGRRRFATEDRSTNVFWLSLVSFGESWHHNHHAFPRSALHGLRWWEVDVGGWVIRAMKRLGLAWNVVLITKERQQQKLAAAAQNAQNAAASATQTAQTAAAQAAQAAKGKPHGPAGAGA
jgi:stearoyl-CoA desaturase (Delta-9 desaturase)